MFIFRFQNSNEPSKCKPINSEVVNNSQLLKKLCNISLVRTCTVSLPDSIAAELCELGLVEVNQSSIFLISQGRLF